ncbi:MAG: hypothetical protein HWQ38_08070 [Nostoc sp. NMS7]|uniref:hypothetical protein n=1 Tax=Nostoc sp. NMS7 TaxID=2815391 RepID=UPI0025CF5B63|nr:hypothetical protein [Nostoc sp. NMS7]MBN3946438.1 hypothetical protein [Nostoc sp. NMS7]
MLSPYSQLCSDFFIDLNNYFTNYFELEQTYRNEGIAPGDRFGVITIRSLDPDPSKTSGTEVRQGFEFLLVKMEILMTLGASDRISSEGLALAAALDLHHGIPALKQFLRESLIYDLKTDEQITTVKRQALKSPNNYIVDVVCGAIANIAIYVDINGQHVIK